MTETTDAEPRRSSGGESERRASWAGFFGGLVSGIVIGAVGGAIAGLVLAWLTPGVVEQIEGPSCDDTHDLVAVTPTSVGATSWHHEQDEQDIEHRPHRAIDLDSGTAWVEEGDDAYGRGEVIRFEFEEDVDLRLICVVNGYANSWASYERNSRARQWLVETGSGSTIGVMADKTAVTYAAFQEMAFEEGPTNYVNMVIQSTRASLGDAGETDTALSEVEFWASRADVPLPSVPTPTEMTAPPEPVEHRQGDR